MAVDYLRFYTNWILILQTINTAISKKQIRKILHLYKLTQQLIYKVGIKYEEMWKTFLHSKFHFINRKEGVCVLIFIPFNGALSIYLKSTICEREAKRAEWVRSPSKKELTDIYREIDEPNGFTLNIIIIILIILISEFPFAASISLCSTTCCACRFYTFR